MVIEVEQGLLATLESNPKPSGFSTISGVGSIVGVLVMHGVDSGMEESIPNPNGLITISGVEVGALVLLGHGELVVKILAM